MRVRVSTLKRLERLEMSRATRRDRTVESWGPVMGLDEWEALAIPSQEALIEFTRELVLGPEYRIGSIVTERDPQDVTHRYKPESRMFGDVVKEVPPELDTAAQKRVNVKGSYYR